MLCRLVALLLVLQHVHCGYQHPTQQNYQQQHQQYQQQQHQQHQQQQNRYPQPQHPQQQQQQQQPYPPHQSQQPGYNHYYQNQQNHNRDQAVKAFQTHYPSHSPQVVHNHHPSYQPQQQQHQHCDIPPDLWCDSAQAAQQCGVTRQCDALRQRRPPLKISLIYEALCPYCQKFIANQLGSIFNQFKGQFELELIPWGNARILRDGSFSCNHGKIECDSNRLMSCVIDSLKVKGALPFIVCFERALSHHSVEGGLQQCSAFIRAQYRQIRQCYDGERGIQLQRAAAHKTMSTRPHPILEVPYLLINDYTPSVDNNNLNVMLLPQLLNKWIKIYGR